MEMRRKGMIPSQPRDKIMYTRKKIEQTGKSLLPSL